MKKETKRNLIIGGRSIASILLGFLGWRIYRSRDYSIRMILDNGKNPTIKVPSGEKISYAYTVKGYNIDGEQRKNVNFVAVESIENPNTRCGNVINVPDGKKSKYCKFK